MNKTQYGNDYNGHLLEQYKLYVEMADRVSQRRMDTNKFFISVQTLMIAFITLFNKDSYMVLIIAALIGFLLSCAWFFLLKNYRQLNSSKFKVIHELESQLPCAPYNKEWDHLGKGREKGIYWPLSHLEIALPVVFAIMYLIFIVYIRYCVRNGLDIPINSV